ncbi:hypothetical protein Esi_0002_0025 [Ectocarpus siliculosus]|uniref:Uncharacterized protein n=1 Tax=Ectocarpus siliculosus TaxID=2880 RepID=D7FPX4_ECTSI|nr:hypothetical protein Esi_0002_0025 [Ectocarpus siliculosus]|eukprot:CBJ48306.1 hypothetical protein Esi_0002_0025 [Ectocarpus siliculosus]
MATCLNSGAGATTASAVARSGGGSLSKGVGGPLAPVAKTLAGAGINGHDGRSRGRCGIGEVGASASRENTVGLPKAPTMNGARSRRGQGGMNTPPEQRQEHLPPSPLGGADKASSANGISTIRQTPAPRCTMSSTAETTSWTGVGGDTREESVDAAGEAEPGPRACETTQELPRLPRPPPPPLNAATPSSSSSLKPTGGGRSSTPLLNRAEKQQAADREGRSTPLPQVAAEAEPAPPGPQENTPSCVDVPALPTLTLPPAPACSPSSKPAATTTTTAADAAACEEAQASRKSAGIRSGAADAAARPPDRRDATRPPGAAAAAASPSVVAVSSCQKPPAAAAAAATAAAPVAAASAIRPAEDADAAVTPAADVTSSPPRAAKRVRVEEEGGNGRDNGSSRATGMDIDSGSVLGGSSDDDSKRQGAGGEEAEGAEGREGDGVAAGSDANRPGAGPEAGAASPPSDGSRKRVRTVVVVGAPPGEEIRPVAAAVPEPLLQVPEVSEADVGKLVLSETGAGTLTGVVEAFEETGDGLGAWTIRYENGDVARLDDCGELHDDMCSYFEFAGNAAAAAAKHVRTRHLPPRAQEEVRLGLFKGKGMDSVVGRRVSVFREKILYEGWVTKYVQPTRDGEIDQWRVAFDAACESQPMDMDSFELLRPLLLHVERRIEQREVQWGHRKVVIYMHRTGDSSRPFTTLPGICASMPTMTIESEEQGQEGTSQQQQ